MQSPYNLIPDIPPSLYTSHLNIISNNNGGNRPLWQRGQEYFEIEIHSDRNGDTDLLQDDIGKILNFNKYTCHICNIEVPNMYMKEHNNSMKHKTCINIANIALERTKLQIQLDATVSRKVEVLDSYFCEPCSTVILTSDKETHEKTKQHKISAKHDKLLNELLEIYTDSNNVEIESEIDELELLKQKIEAESPLEESGSLLEESGSISEEFHAPQTEADTNIREEVINAIAVDIKLVLEEEFKKTSVEFNDKVKILEDSMLKCQRSFDKINVDSNQIKSNINILDKHIDDLNQTTLIPVKKHSKTKILKKCQIKKKKERFDRVSTSLMAIKTAEEETAVPVEGTFDQSQQRFDQIKKTLDLDVDNVDQSKVISESPSETANQIQIEEVTELYEKEVAQSMNENHSTDIRKKKTFEADNFMNENAPLVSNKIDKILAKYFDKTRTVDALKINSGIEHKNRVAKKNRHSNEIQLSKDKHGHNKDETMELNNVSQEQNATIDKDPELTKDTINDTNKEEIIEDIEHNNNTDQNKNAIEQLIENQEQNNNYSTENKNTDTQKQVEKQKNVKQENKKNKNKKHVELEAKPKQAKIETPSFNLVNYLKDIARRCQDKPIHTVEAVTDAIVQITAINGDRIKVLVNNFHSFHVKAQNIFCKVCENPNIRRPEWHIIENEHREKIMIPIHDHNGIRQLDDIWSHCILCNDLTKSTDFHLQSLLHKNKVKHCLVELGTNIDNNRHPIEENTPKVHKDHAIVELILKNHLALTNKDYLNCIVCDVIIDYDLLAIKQHITSFVHLNNFEQLWNTNQLVNLNDDKFYCVPCDVNITKLEIISHCKGAKHKKLLPETLNKNGTENNEILTPYMRNGNEIVLSSISQNVKHCKSELDASELICFVCNIILYCIDEHMDSFQHKKSYYSYLEANKLNEIEADTFYCIPCNTVITIDYLMSHGTSKKHKLALNNYLGNANVQSVKSDQNETNIESLTPIATTSQILLSSPSNTKVMPLKVLYQFKELTDSNKLLCIVCEEEIHYSKKLAEYHVSTLDHVVAFNLMMLWNKIKKRDDKYYCDICHLDMTYFSEITHVLGKQHASNLAKEPKGTVYEYDRTLLTHAYAMSHKVGSRTRLRSVVSVKPDKL